MPGRFRWNFDPRTREVVRAALERPEALLAVAQRAEVGAAERPQLVLEEQAEEAAGGGGRGAAPVPGVLMPTSDISPLWGISYVEMGAEGRSNHVSQGTPTVFGAGFGRRQSSLAVEKGDAAAGLFDPMLLHESISSLAARFPSLQSMMAPPLASADQALASAANQTLALDRTAAAHSIAAAGKQIAALRDQISNQNGDDKAQALYEIDQVRAKIDHALEDVVSLSIAVNADRHELVAGENFIVEVNLPDKPAVPVKYTVDASTIQAALGLGRFTRACETAQCEWQRQTLPIRIRR